MHAATLVARTAATLLLTASLCAQADEAFLRAAFARLDLDGDGMLPRKEFPGSDRQFTALDADKNGTATFAEFRDSEVGKALLRARYRGQQDAHPRTTAAALAPLRFPWLLRFDPNRDGRIVRAEWTGTEDAFLQLDQDGNGTIDKRDRAEAEANAPPPPPELPPVKGDPPMLDALLRRHDKDRDGRLAGRELQADKWLVAALPWADQDGDRALGEDELRRLLQAVLTQRASAAAARERPVPYDVPFDAWDQDQDGKVRQNEWQGPLSVFLAVDRDRDAAVSRDEVLRYRRRITGDDFVSRFDLDGDGKVTAAEFQGPPGAFLRADRNGDGAVSRADG